MTDEPGHETTVYVGVKQRVGDTWVDRPVPAGGQSLDDRLAAIETTLAAILAKLPGE